jgi:thiol-disulfide isomerase/thioredoxin
MDFAMHHENAVRKYEPRNGGYEMVILDSVEWLGVRKPENYKALHRVDFDNPLLLTCNQYPMMLNRIQFARPVRSIQYEGLLDEDGAIDNNVETDKKVLLNGMTAYRKLMGTEGDNFLTQLCAYKNMANAFNSWRSNEASIPEILVDTTMTVAEREEVAATIQTPSRMMPIYLNVFSNPYILQKAEAFYAYKLAQTELSTPLPANNAAADLIRSLCAKYPGRYLVIDFWGMNCGPCKSAIQSSKNKRAEIAKRNDVKLIFIAGERTAEGSDAYHNYVKEWLADEVTICLTHNFFGRLQELFHFNGIPHYETITPDGRRVRDDLKLDGYYNFDYELNHLKDKLK